MKKKIAKLLALGMSIALVFSLAACGGTEDAESTEDTTPAAFVVDDGEAGTGDAAAPSEDASAADPSETGSANGGTGNNGTGNNGTGTQTPSESGVKAPTNVDEAIALYNSAVSKAGFTKANVQRTWGGSDTSLGDLNGPALGNGAVADSFNKPETFNVKPATLNKADDASVTPGSSGNSITIKFTLRNVTVDSSAAYGAKGYPYFISYDDANHLIQTIGHDQFGLEITLNKDSASFALKDGVINVTIDKTSGKATSLTLNFGEEVNGKATAKIGGLPVSVTAKIWGTGKVTFA